MLWSDFGPYVLPHVIGAPEPLMQLHVRLAAIEFCRRTLCHIRTLDPVTTDGTALVELAPDAGTQIVKVKAVEVGGKEWTLVNARQGHAHVRSGTQQDFAFTEDNLTLQVFQPQAAGVDVVVDAALAPTLASSSIDDAVGAQHASDIAHGAVASLKRINNQPYTDMAGSGVEQTLFERRIATVAAKVARGMANTKMRSFQTYL
jgi:hypothetical protein